MTTELKNRRGGMESKAVKVCVFYFRNKAIKIEILFGKNDFK